MKDVYEKLYKLLAEWNGKFNLTAIKSKEDYEIKHIRDSMLGLPYISGKVLDIGSGAGFPRRDGGKQAEKLFYGACAVCARCTVCLFAKHDGCLPSLR